MIQIYNEPNTSQLEALCKRYEGQQANIENDVWNIINEIKEKGDDALLALTQKFDAVIDSISISNEEWDAVDEIDINLKKAIDIAFENIWKFHEAQTQQTLNVETTPGIFCSRKTVAIQNVGLYIPGGTAPLFSSLLMLGIPAKIAACNNIVICTPPQKNGLVHNSILYIAQKLGIKNIYKCGGAQAIAAMYFGTNTITKVDKILGPGNRYVTLAKQILSSKGLAIDMPAGPSEVLVYADEDANPIFIAADLLSQAEHGIDSQAILVCTTKEIADSVNKEIGKQIETLSRKEIILKSLENSRIIIFADSNNAIDYINMYAPEHLIISTQNCKFIEQKIINAGSIFLGNYTPESLGDYASGTNHTLPTHGFAKAYSGVSLDSFTKKITVQISNKTGLQNISETVITMAIAEGLDAHANAVKLRLEELNNN